MTILKKQYRIPFMLALSLHVALLVFLLNTFVLKHKSTLSQNNTSPIIEAVAINPTPAVAPKKPLLPPTVDPTTPPVENTVEPLRPSQDTVLAQQQEQQRQAEELQAKIEAKAEMERQRVLQEQIQRETQQRKLAEQKAIALKNEELKKQKLLEKKKQEEARKKALEQQLQQQLALDEKKMQQMQKEQKLKEEKLKKEQAAQQVLARKKQLEQLLNQQLAAEQAASDKAAKAAMNAQMQGIIDKYKTMIQQAISRKWIIPDNANRDLSCKLKIRLAADGTVLDVQIVSSSGDDALDRSARTAVFKASPLPVPSDSNLFETFRELNLTVKPETSSKEE